MRMRLIWRALDNIIFIVLLTLLGSERAAANNGAVRLVNGIDRCSGRVEIQHSGQWGTVCDDGWDTNDAGVVCRMLDCGGVKEAPGSARFGSGEGTIWLDDVQCSGSEASLLNCQHGGLGTHNCNHGEDAGVICFGSTVRLINGSDRCSGRVEIQHSGQWGTVCDDGWDTNDARVVCRMLDCGGVIEAPGSARFGSGKGTIWLDDVQCSGSETSLLNCQHGGLGTHNCNHGEDAGLLCYDGPKNISVSVSPSGDIVEGSSMTLTCNSKANPPADTHTWYRNGTEISQRGSWKDYNITNVTSDDSGQYYCVAANGHGTGTSTLYTLNVLYSPKNTSVSANLTGDIVEGSSMTLTCNSKANPPADTYTWYRNGTEISQRGSWKDYNITNVTSDNSGQYYCVAANGHGTGASTLYTLNVLYGPKNTLLLITPSGDIVEGSSVTLTCNSKANPPVDTYTWFKMNGTEIAQIGSAQNYIITDIRPHDGGEYYCEAKNKYGTANSTAVFVNVYKPGVSLAVIIIGSLVAIPILAFIIYIKRKTSRTPEPRNGETPVSKNSTFDMCENVYENIK